MVRVLGFSHRRAEGHLSPVALALPRVEEIPVAQTAAPPHPPADPCPPQAALAFL